MISLTNPVWGKLHYLSASRIKAFMRCGIKFELEYVNEMRAPGSINMHRGSSMHKAIEEDNKNFLETGSRLKLRQLKEIAFDCFFDKLEEGVFIPFRDIDRKEKLMNKATLELEECIKLYAGMEKSWIPAEVEVSYMEHIGYPLPMNARIDLIDENSMIYDWKTSTKATSRGIDLQQLIYCKIYEHVYEITPTFQYVNFIIKKKPEVVIQVMPQPKDYKLLDLYINTYIKAIEADIYLPASDTDFCCSDGSCPFYLNCEAKKID